MMSLFIDMYSVIHLMAAAVYIYSWSLAVKVRIQDNDCN